MTLFLRQLIAKSSVSTTVDVLKTRLYDYRTNSANRTFIGFSIKWKIKFEMYKKLG